MAIDIKAYTDELLKAAGVTDDAQRQAVASVLSNSAAVDFIDKSQLRQSDYSRRMDALREQDQKNADYYKTLAQWEAQRKADYDKAFSELGSGNGNGNNGNAADIDKRFKEMDDRYKQVAAQQEQSFITIAKKMGKLASQHAVDFKEALDTDALEKIAIEKKLDLDHAYDALVADRRKAQQDASFAERIKRERLEAVQEFASSRNLPVDSGPRDVGYGRMSLIPSKENQVTAVPHEGRLTPEGYVNLRSGFVDEWNKSGGGQQ